jgi:hypothetical protein
VTGAVAMARARSGGRCLEAKTATNDSQYREMLQKRPSLFTRDDSMFLTVSLSLLACSDASVPVDLVLHYCDVL